MLLSGRQEALSHNRTLSEYDGEGGGRVNYNNVSFKLYIELVGNSMCVFNLQLIL